MCAIKKSRIPVKSEITPNKIPKEARQMAGFIDLVIDAATQKTSDPSQYLRCFGKKCDGTISTVFSADNQEILWKCSKCNKSGNITGWQGSYWDNTSR